MPEFFAKVMMAVGLVSVFLSLPAIFVYSGVFWFPPILVGIFFWFIGLLIFLFKA